MTELDIRNAIIAAMSGTAKWSSSTFIPEMFVDEFARRADLVVAGDKLIAFEIKSERDKLDRLDGQLKSYTRFFEQVTVVCAERHLEGIEANSLSEVGIWTVRKDGSIRKVRKAKNLDQRSLDSWLSFLPVDELRKLLRSHGIKHGRNRPELLVASTGVPLKAIRRYVLEYLRRRDERIQERVRKKGQGRSIAPPSIEEYLKTLGNQAITATPRARPHSSKPSPSSSPA
jgi:hypothetical protein